MFKGFGGSLFISKAPAAAWNVYPAEASSRTFAFGFVNKFYKVSFGPLLKAFKQGLQDLGLCRRGFRKDEDKMGFGPPKPLGSKWFRI